MKNHFDASSLDSLGRNEEALDTYRSDLDVLELVKVPNNGDSDDYNFNYIDDDDNNQENSDNEDNTDIDINGWMEIIE